MARGVHAFPVAADESSGDATGEGIKDPGLTLPDQLPSANAVAVSPDPTDDGSPSPITPGPTPDIDLPDKKSDLQNVFTSVQGTDPDRAAKVVAIQNKINEPAAYIDKNLPDIQRALSAPSTSFFKQLEAQYPGTTQFLSDPRNMAVAQDDLPNVADHEGLIKNAGSDMSLLDSIKNEFSSDYTAFKYGAETSATGMAVRGKLPDIPAPQNPNWRQGLSEQLGGLLPDLPLMAASDVVGSGVGAVAGGAAGIPGALPGILTGAEIGAAGGGTAAAFAIPGAIKAALIQKYQDGKITSYADILKEFAKQGLVGLATAGAGGLAAKTVGGAVAPLIAENAAMTVAGAGVEGKAPTAQEFLNNMLTVGALHGAHELASKVPDGLQAIFQDQKTDYAKDFYTALGDTAAASKLRERLPEAHQDLVASLTKDGPVENVYIPADAAQSYFQSKNIDPDEMMSDLGVTKSFEEAKQTGGDVEIPLSTWINKVVGTEHYQGLANDIKFDPEDLTANQVTNRKADVQSQVQEIMDQRKAEADAQASDQQKQDKLDNISDGISKIRDQLKAAGLSGQESDFNPQLHEAFFNTLGQHLGVDPDELADRFPLKIQSSEDPTGNVTDMERTTDSSSDEELRMAAQNQDHKTLNQSDIAGSKEERLSRAKEMGFDTDKTWYHGTPGGKLESFDHSNSNYPGIAGFFTSDKEFARKFSSDPYYAQNKPGWSVDENGENGRANSPFIHKVFLKAKDTFDYEKPADLKRLRAAIKNEYGSDRAKYHIDAIKAQLDGSSHKMWQVLEDPEIISAAKAAGFDSMHISESGVKNIAVFDNTHVRSINADFDPSLSGSDKIYSQGAPKLDPGPRGRITIGREGYAIDLFKSADKSTFLHETGHYFLEVMGHIANDDSAPKQVKEDYQTLLKWMGVGSKEEIGTEQHEKFARGFEQYLMEGKAPSSALTRAFGRFRKWLTAIYQHASNLKVDMNDDVRGVMDRMLASEHEVGRAQEAIGYRNESIQGIPPELESKINDLQSQARDQAERSLLKEQMAETTEKHKEFLKSETARQTDIAEKQVDELPIFKVSDEAVSIIGKDKTIGTIAEKFLSDKLKTEDAGKFEALAEVHGFGSGEEMAHAMILSEEGKQRQAEIDSRVQTAMTPHADLMNTEAIRSEALRSVHSEKMTELLALEREAISNLANKASVNQEVSRRKKLEAKVDAQAAKEQAREILSNKPVKEATNARPYITAERNAAVKVAKALASGDYAKAAEFKRQQMLNHAIVSEAIRNHIEADKSISYLSDYANRKADLKDMPYGFTRQIDQLLSKSGFAADRIEDTGTLTAIAKDMAAKGEDPAEIANRTGFKQDQNGNWTPESLPDFVSRANDNYYAMSLPDSVMSGADKNYQDLSMGDLRELKHAVKQIADIGKKYDRFLGEFKTMDVKQAASAFLASITDKFGTPFKDDLQPGSQHATKLSELLSNLSKFWGPFNRQLDTILTTCHKFDGLEEGPAKEFIYRPLEEAASRETAHVATKMKEMDAVFAKHYGLDEFAKYKDTKVNVDGRYFTKEEILSMALNWGNEGNRQRLMSGFGFDEAKMDRIFKSLGKKDWDFAQDTWNHLNEYRPDISKLEMDVNGVEAKFVEPAPFSNEHGNYDGGYYPIKYDFEKSADAYQNEQQKDALYKQFSTAAAHTEQGHTQARATNVTRPLRLDLDVIKSHHEDVIHDLEFRRAVIDVNRFLNQKDVKQGIMNAAGVKGYGSISDWLKNAAGGSSEPITFGDKAMQWLRFKATFFNMGWRIVSAPKILAENLVNLSSEVGMSGAAGALKDYYFGDSGVHEMVTGKSDFMRLRGQHLDRDLSDVQNKWQGTPQSGFKRFAFFIHAYLDQGVSFPLWADAYKRGLAEHGDEQKAINQGDEAVKRTFMSGGTVDQAAVMRGSEKQKALTTAYGYQSMMWNRFSMQNFEAGQQWIQGNRTAAVAIAARAAVYTFLMPALIDTLSAELLRNSVSSNDDDKKKRMAAHFLEGATPLKFIPVLRDVAPWVVKKSLGERGNDLQVTPLEQAAETLLTPAAEGLHSVFTGKNLPDKFPEQTANALSLVSGVPKQINDIVFNFIDWQSHNGELTWRDFMSRKTKK